MESRSHSRRSSTSYFWSVESKINNSHDNTVDSGTSEWKFEAPWLSHPSQWWCAKSNSVSGVGVWYRWKDESRLTFITGRCGRWVDNGVSS